jgi:hypothetical protein
MPDLTLTDQPLQWRLIITDTESPTGIAPVCTKPHDEQGVYDCCPQPHVETFSESEADSMVARLNAGTPLGVVLREAHHPVDGSRDNDGSCIADGHDWPCPVITALYAAEAGESR